MAAAAKGSATSPPWAEGAAHKLDLNPAMK
jgi:hypothetical protein